MSMEHEAQNTDRELWRSSDSFYAPSIHVTQDGGIGMNVGGHIIVMPIEKWHSLGVNFLKAGKITFRPFVDWEEHYRQMTPPTATLIERGTKVFSAIWKRLGVSA